MVGPRGKHEGIRHGYKILIVQFGEEDGDVIIKLRYVLKNYRVMWDGFIWAHKNVRQWRTLMNIQ
jgi:hypothetical protein